MEYDLLDTAKKYEQSSLLSKEQAADYQKLSGGLTMAQGFSQIVGSFADYSLLKANISNYYAQANSILLQAKESANQLRQQYIQAAGNYEFGAAQRGISVKSGSVRSNLEQSAINIGKDVSKMQSNAQMQAQTLRQQAKMQKHAGKAKMYQGLTSGVMNIASGGISYATAGK